MSSDQKPTHEDRQNMADTVMQYIATVLPEAVRNSGPSRLLVAVFHPLREHAV
jgi:hypothetical protein